MKSPFRSRLLVAAFFISLAPSFGLSTARSGAGDEALAAFMSGNFRRARRLAQSAAGDGDMLAQFVLGRINEEIVPRNKTEARKWFRRALAQALRGAKRGDPRAQYVLGRLTEDGLGLPKNVAKAISWYRKSAEQGYAPAQFNMGFFYFYGSGVPKDSGQALSWYLKSAERGYASAQYALGFMYEGGMGGLPQDRHEALSWYRKAAAQGFMPEPREDKSEKDLWSEASATRPARR